MSYEISYANVPEKQKDAKAIKDIKDYIAPEQWDILMQLVGDKTMPLTQIDIALHFCGVQGFPIFAFMRKYRPEDYSAWYESLPDA